MKKFLIPVLFCAISGAVLVSCKNESSSTGEVQSDKEQVLQQVMTPYINHAVHPVYEGMAAAAVQLAEDFAAILEASQNDPESTDTALVHQACEHWTESRLFWERSEAWLYGPADYEGIDPHIDSWPFNKTEFDNIINSEEEMHKYSQALLNNTPLEEEEYGLLGYHAVEYVLFNNGLAHAIGDWSTNAWTFMNVVANDLRNQAILLSACWEGLGNIPAAQQAFLQSSGLSTTAQRYSTNGFGDYMLNPGEGRQFATYEEAAQQLLEGCIDIANEVGNIKIGTACLAAADNITGRNYIESPYSLHSIKDFTDNIVSIDYACFGAQEGDYSLGEYINKVAPDEAQALREAIDESYEAIQAIPEPFYDNAQGEAAQNAVVVVGTDLVAALQSVYKVLTGVEYELEEE